MQAQKTRKKRNQTSKTPKFAPPRVHQAPLLAKSQRKSKQTKILDSIFYSDEEVSNYQKPGTSIDMVQQQEICQEKKEFYIESKYCDQGKSSLPNKNKRILKEKKAKNQLIARMHMERIATREQIKVDSLKSFLDQELQQQSQSQDSCKKLKKINFLHQPQMNAPQDNLFRYVIPKVDQNAMDQQFPQRNIQIQQPRKQKPDEYMGQLANKGIAKQNQTRGFFNANYQNQPVKQPQYSAQQLQLQRKEIIRQRFIKTKRYLQQRKKARQLVKEQVFTPSKDIQFRENILTRSNLNDQSMAEMMQQQYSNSNKKYIPDSSPRSFSSKILNISKFNICHPINQILDSRCPQRMEIQPQKMQQEGLVRQNKRRQVKKKVFKRTQGLSQVKSLLSREDKSNIFGKIKEINRISRLSSQSKAKEHQIQQNNKQIVSQLCKSQISKKKENSTTKSTTTFYSPLTNKCSYKLSNIAQWSSVKQEYQQKNAIQQDIEDGSESQLSQFVNNQQYCNDFQNESMEMYFNRSRPKRLQILNRYNYNPFQEQPRIDQCRLWKMLMQEATQQDFTALFHKYTPDSQLLKDAEICSKRIAYPRNLNQQHFELPNLYDPETKSLKKKSKQLFKGYQFSPVTLSDKKASDQPQFKGAEDLMLKQQINYQQMIPEKKDQMRKLPEVSQQRMSLIQKKLTRRNRKKNKKRLNQSQQKFIYDQLEEFEIPVYSSKSEIQMKMMNISPQGQQMPSEMELEFV